jgi:diacylglycerol kinase family enzyme
MRRGVLIVNPNASGVTEERLRAVERALSRAVSVRTVLTERPGHAVELVEGATEAEVVFVFSGDGGFNEAVNGLDGEVPIGFVPGGGASVLPRLLGLPRDPVAAAERLADAAAAGRTRRISVGRVNGRRFAFSCGVGLDAEVVRRVDALGRERYGRRPPDSVYLRAGAAILAERRWRLDPRMTIRGLGRAAFALVAKAATYTYAGPLPIRATPLARLEGGLDVVAPIRLRPATVPRLLAYAARGRGIEHARDILYGHDLDSVEIVCDRPTALQVDGEDLGDVERVVCECERDALSVLV